MDRKKSWRAFRYIRSARSGCLLICLRPGGRGAANKLEIKWKVSLYVVAPPQAAVGYTTNSSFCCRATFRKNCAVLKLHGHFLSDEAVA